MSRFFFLVCLAIVFSSSGFSQLKSENIVGNWKVIKVHTLIDDIPVEQKQMLAKLEKALLESSFHFTADKKFSFDFAFPDMQIRNGHWKLIQNGEAIIIQDWKDRNTDKGLLMKIFLKRDGDKILFLLEESFFALEMKKE